jgi:cell division transport system permease protein
MLREWRLHALSVFSLAVAFVCLGASLLVLTNLRAIEERWAHAGRASIYLKDNAQAQDVESLKQALANVPGILAVRYLSAAQARTEFGQTEVGPKGELASLPVDAFPASIEVEVRPELSDAELTEIVAKLRQLPAVDDVETYQAWTERLSHLAVVGSTIRLALQRRRTEVEVLKLVGASDRFIKGPFLVEGSTQGALGATGAVVILAALFFVVRGRLDAELAGLVGIEPSFLPWYVVVGMIAVGIILGTLAALLGLRRLVTV